MATQARRSKDRLTPSQTRAARRARRRTRRRLLRYGAMGAVASIAFLFIMALFLPSLPFGRTGGLFGGGAPDGPGVRIEDQGRTHLFERGEEHPPYNSVPATSGSHHAQPSAPVRWGVHDEFVADEYRVHNLEHGGVGVHYNCPEGCPELVAQLQEIVDRAVDGGLKVLMSPYPDMDSKIALTAWTFIEELDEFDEDRVKDFIDAHESSPNAPEPDAR